MTDVHVKNTMSYVRTKLIILHSPTSITYNVFSLLQVIYYAFMFFFTLYYIRFGHLEIVQFLVNGNHCQVNAVNNDGWTALHYAAQ